MNGGAPDYEPYEEALPGGGTRVRWRRRDQTAVTPISGNGQVPATREPAAGPDWYFPKGYAPKRVADRLCEAAHFAQGGGQLYVYQKESTPQTGRLTYTGIRQTYLTTGGASAGPMMS